MWQMRRRVFPEEQRARVEVAAHDAALTIIRRRPVVFREGEPPLVALFALVRASDLPRHLHDRPWVEPPLVIRTADGCRSDFLPDNPTNLRNVSTKLNVGDFGTITSRHRPTWR